MAEKDQPATPSADDFDGLSFEQVMALAEESGVSAAELSTKATLVGVPFIITSVTFTTGDNVDEETGELKTFVTCKAITQDGRNVSFIDGSTGIHAQLKMLFDKRPESIGKPIVCKKGLRRSVYDHPEFGPSLTYYLDTSAA